MPPPPIPQDSGKRLPPWLVASRILQGCGGALMLPVGRLIVVRTFAKSELVRAMSFVAIPGLIGPMVGLILFGSGVALLSYVLEVFGEHTLSGREMLMLVAISAFLLAGYGLHTAPLAHPLLELALFRIRTFRAAVSGSFFTRLGIGGIPFLFPLLYQVGFGVASASLVTAIFIPDRFHADALQLVHGIHQAFLILGALTILSAIVFAGLKRDDGSAVSRHKVVLPAE